MGTGGSGNGLNRKRRSGFNGVRQTGGDGMRRRQFLMSGVALAVIGGTGSALAATREEVAYKVVSTWYRLVLELIRHTPTMSPPVASRALAYIGTAAFEALASGDRRLKSLAGQLRDLAPLPTRGPAAMDDAVILTATLDPLVRALFANTGPTGQHALDTLGKRLGAQAADGVAQEVVAASRDHGAALAAAVLDWANDDGGAVIENMGFPMHYTPDPAPGHWVPTSKIVQQQAPLLPGWGKNRPFAMPAADAGPIADPTPYSEAKGSPFWLEAKEVCDAVDHLTPEQTLIARFWSDDAMLTYTPPGHWTAILNQVAEERGLGLSEHVEALARMGVAMADAFIGCWAAKYRYNTIRPVSYIDKLIEAKWQPILTTPPFPEYPSGHSVQSAAAAAMLTALFGQDYAFADQSPAPDGIPQRSFASFDAAADEAAISRLYGGIHFRPAIENGKALGRGIAAYAIALQTRA